jgi:hypothetical protein
VGIRYQYPLTSLSVRMDRPELPQRFHTDKWIFTQSYRRFQVNFASASDATQFINAIRSVCPCKEIAGQPHPPPIPVNKSSVPRSVSIQIPSVCTPLVCYHTSTPRPPLLSAIPPGTVECKPHYSSQEELCQKSHFPPPSSSDLSLAPSSDSAHPTHPTLGFAESSRPSSALPEMYSSQFAGHNKGGGSHHGTSYFPAPSQPTPSATTLASPSQGPNEKENVREAFLESLREDPELHKLTRQELENLVSVVVREPGFPKLVGYVFPSTALLSVLWVTTCC